MIYYRISYVNSDILRIDVICNEGRAAVRSTAEMLKMRKQIKPIKRIEIRQSFITRYQYISYKPF